MERKPDAAEGVHGFIKFKFWFSSEEQVPYPKGFSNAPLAQLLRKSPLGLLVRAGDSAQSCGEYKSKRRNSSDVSSGPPCGWGDEIHSGSLRSGPNEFSPTVRFPGTRRWGGVGGEVLRGTARGRFTRSLGLGFEGYFNRRG